MIITLHPDPALPGGAMALPPPLSGAAELHLRLGSRTTLARVVASGLQATAQLAPDLWEALAIPYEGMRLRAERRAPDLLELTPSVGVLCPGGMTGPFLHVPSPFAALAGEPGLFGLGFERGIDWESGRMNGYIPDNRSASPTSLVAARFPIPRVLWLMPGVCAKVRRQLRSAANLIAFNAISSLDPWRCHTLLAESPVLSPHLPESRRLRSAVDLAALLVRHPAVLVLTRGRRPLLVVQTEDGICVSGESCASLAAAGDRLGELTQNRPMVVQPRLRLALRLRCLTVQGKTGWRLLFHAVYGTRRGTLTALVRQLAIPRREARRLLRRIEHLCRTAARLLGEALHPLGILGIDIGLGPGAEGLWILSVTPRPRWPTAPTIRMRIMESQIAYGLLLAQAERLPE